MRLVVGDRLIDEPMPDLNKVTYCKYEGQNTITDLLSTMIHECGNKIALFGNSFALMKRHHTKVMQNIPPTVGDLDELYRRSEQMQDYAKSVLDTFRDYEKFLPQQSKPEKQMFRLTESIYEAIANYERAIDDLDIDVQIVGYHDAICPYFGIRTIFDNLVQNSICWMVDTHPGDRKIMVELHVDRHSTDSDHLKYIDYRDSGPGISKEVIADGRLFKPRYSTRGGHGLGLTLAGEAAERNNLDFLCIESDAGAHFRLQYKEVTHVEQAIDGLRRAGVSKEEV